ncbi:hypothetical protein COLO4_10910 [Corchorus olitorius]|uniref:Uncharacterized protein n=1 Tax=Corchorus olitorius TaxID=93759 RepID=A0A1R3K6F5_9ROSI|nr:hypothetical protein COLO4_10910 [Corchorus olitorius]
MKLQLEDGSNQTGSCSGKKESNPNPNPCPICLGPMVQESSLGKTALQ